MISEERLAIALGTIMGVFAVASGFNLIVMAFVAIAEAIVVKSLWRWIA